MILKTKTMKKKVTRVETVKRKETYVEALTRIRNEVAKLINIDGLDCTAIGEKCSLSCITCPLGSKTAVDGKRCLPKRIDDMIAESIEKAEDVDL